MHNIAKLMRWLAPVLALSIIGLTLFSGQPFIINAAGSIRSVNTSQCPIPIGPQIPASPTLESCYQSMLGKFGNLLLVDVTSLLVSRHSTPADTSRVLKALQSMKGPNLQPSVAQLAVRSGYKGNSYAWERQELILIGKTSVDQGKIDPMLVYNYDARADRDLFDHLIKLELPAITNQKLDQWITLAIMQTPATQLCNHIQLSRSNIAVHVDIPDSSHQGDLTYQGGAVVDGIANVYLVFWEDSAFQSLSPKYVSLIQQFVSDIGRSPLYANLSQYKDTLGRCPVGAKLAGTFIDRQSFEKLLGDP